MSDGAGNEAMGLAEHVGLAGGPAALLGFAMRWIHSSGQARLETTLAVLVQKVDSIAEDQKKHEGLAERVALLEASVRALHERLDNKRKR